MDKVCRHFSCFFVGVGRFHRQRIKTAQRIGIMTLVKFCFRIQYTPGSLGCCRIVQIYIAGLYEQWEIFPILYHIHLKKAPPLIRPVSIPEPFLRKVVCRCGQWLPLP